MNGLLQPEASVTEKRYTVKLGYETENHDQIQSLGRLPLESDL